MSSLSITAIILTYNEEIHLQRCLNSVKSICSEIIVVDSFSADKTQEIAETNGATFVQNTWKNYAEQFNWALDNLNIKTEWILRLDADEYLSDNLKKELQENLSNVTTATNGITFPLRRVFLGKQINHGGTNNIRLLRMFRTNKGRAESRWMDEHIELDNGATLDFKECFSDDNLNNISWWTQKHVGYAIREAVDLLDIELGLINPLNKKESIDKQALTKRKIKYKYVKQPLFFRAFAYFVYRYFIKLGFMDGKVGFLWHFLQGWWYRTLVDVKVYEIKKQCGNDVIKIKHYLKQYYNINL